MDVRKEHDAIGKRELAKVSLEQNRLMGMSAVKSIAQGLLFQIPRGKYYLITEV